MTDEGNITRLLSAIEKQGEHFRAAIEQQGEHFRADLETATKEMRGHYRNLASTVADLGQQLGDVRASASRAEDVAASARSRVSDISELAAQTKQHQSSSDLEAEARHAALIEQKAKKDLETSQKIAELDAKFEAFTASKKEGGAPLTLAKIDDNNRRRNGATWLAVVLAALGVAGKAADIVTSHAQASQPVHQVRP